MNDKQLLSLDDAEPCDCNECKNMCERPCWGTPAEIVELIRAGHTKSLMLDWYYGVDGDDDIYILCPAIKGYEGERAPFWPSSGAGCTFQDYETGLCDIYSIRPYEARVARCDREKPGNVHRAVARTWESVEGRRLVAQWEKQELAEK